MEVDYRVLALAAMLSLGAYNFAIRKFFVEKEDWRMLIPVIVLAALALGAYYAATYKSVKTTEKSLFYAGMLVVIGAFALFLPYITLAQPDAKLNVAMPIIALSTVVTVGLGIVFLGEQLTAYRIAGIILALASIVLLVID